jgi:HlyD family secretion protein
MNATTPPDALKPPTQGVPTVASTAPSKPGLGALLDEPAAKPWYRRPMLWAAVVAVLLLLGALAWWWSNRAANAAPTYTTQPVTRGNLTLSVTANGTVQPTRSINIGSELSGTVLKVNVDVNDTIKKGQVLVVLDAAKLRDQILRSQAALTGAQAKLAQTEATISEARAALGRLEAWRGPSPTTAALAPASAKPEPRCPPTKSTCQKPPSWHQPTAWC